MTDEWKPSAHAEAERKPNGHSRPEDFLMPEFEEVILPSGLKCKLRPMSQLEVLVRAGALPKRLGKSPQPGDAIETPDEETLADALDWANRVICAVFVDPKFSTSPGPGEYHPNRLREADREFISEWSKKWLGGGSAAEESFRAQRRPAADRAGSGNFPPPAKPDSSGNG